MKVVTEEGIEWSVPSFCSILQRRRRRESWQILIDLYARQNGAWVAIGDFNNLLSIEDKDSGMAPSDALLSGFRETVESCQLIDLPLLRYKYPWSRGSMDNLIKENLDKCMVKDRWLTHFPYARLKNHTAPVSDHTPILLMYDRRRNG